MVLQSAVYVLVNRELLREKGNDISHVDAEGNLDA